MAIEHQILPQVVSAPGLLAVTDPRVFCVDRREFACRLSEQLASLPQMREVRLDLESGCCRLSFSPQVTSLQEMAEVFVANIRAASRRAAPSWTPSLRRPQRWTVTLQRGSNNGCPTRLEGYAARPGQLQLRIVGPAASRFCRAAIIDALGTEPGIQGLRVHRGARAVDIEFDPAQRQRDDVLDGVARAFGPCGETAPENGERNARSPDRPPPLLVYGPRRLLYLGVGGGSFVMALVGLVVPGVPTVPFVLASSYYFARSSPAVHRKLLQSRLFGQLLKEWETHRAMSRSSKWRLAGFTLTVIAITAAFAPLSPVLVLMVALMATLSLYGIARIPEIDAQVFVDHAVAA